MTTCSLYARSSRASHSLLPHHLDAVPILGPCPQRHRAATRHHGGSGFYIADTAPGTTQEAAVNVNTIFIANAGANAHLAVSPIADPSPPLKYSHVDFRSTIIQQPFLEINYSMLLDGAHGQQYIVTAVTIGTYPLECLTTLDSLATQDLHV